MNKDSTKDRLLTKEASEAFLASYFSDAQFPGAYVLGCFARRVTIYSQQIRALNLVCALLQSGRVTGRSEVAIIGAGAAGMTASAALEKAGVRVTVFERSQDAMQFQANNTQRFLHPNIYEWPSPDAESDFANLPILDWRSGTAYEVARHLKRRWKKFVPPNQVHYNVQDLNLDPRPGGGGIRVTCTTRKPQVYPVVIIAVGFGLEEGNLQRSYWSNDNLDNEFPRSGKQERWLISGYGDGAYTDLMRLCLHNFRHHEIVRLFQSTAAIRGVRTDIDVIHRENSKDHNHLSDQFETLQTTALEDKLRPLLRRNGPKVVLTGRDSYPYKPEASSLNRLITLVLANLGAFATRPGPTRDTKPVDVGEGYEVKLAGEKSEYFDNVVLRHGPQSAIENSLNSLWSSCETLRKSWERLLPSEDPTPQRQWPYGFFGPEVEIETPVRTVIGSQDPAVRKFGVHARRFTVSREIQDDGSSRSIYVLEGLKVHSGQLQCIRFKASVGFGRIGEPKGDVLSRIVDLTWKGAENRALQDDDDMETRRNKARHTKGTLCFSPLTPATPETTFGFNVESLNADALTPWESRQMASELQVDESQSDGMEEEFAASVVWFPISTFVLRVTIPREVESISFSRFTRGGGNVSVDEVRKDGELLLRPVHEPRWERDVYFIENKDFKLEQIGPNDIGESTSGEDLITWQATVNNPAVGSRFRLGWTLPAPKEDFWTRRLSKRASSWRRVLRRAKQQLDSEIQSQFALNVHRRLTDLDERLRERYAEENGEFEVSLLTYDEDNRRLIVVDGRLNGKKPPESSFEFWMPFGFGLAGAAFKQGRMYTYVRAPSDEPEQGLEFYIPLQGREHRVMTAIPISHPDYHDGLSIERSRQCVAMLDIATTSTNGKLLRAIFEESVYISALCHSILFDRDIPAARPSARDELQSPLTLNGMITPAGWTRHSLSTFSRLLPAQPDAVPANKAKHAAFATLRADAAGTS